MTDTRGKTAAARDRDGSADGAHEEALRRVLQVISRSRDDEAPVFDAILETAAELCEAPFAGLYLLDEATGDTVLVASRGARSAYLATARKRWDRNDKTSVPTSIRTGKVVNAPDLADTDLYRQGHTQRVEAVDVEGIRSFLAVPMIREGRAIGALGIYRREVRPFGRRHVALIETFAEQAVIAIENARQFREVEERLEREKASREILQAISASRTDPAPVFDAILRNAARLSGAPLANLCLANAARSHWHLVAHFGDGLRHLTAGTTATPLDSELAPAVAIRSARVVHIEDLSETDLDRQGDRGRIAMVEAEGMRTVLCVPLLGDTEAIGCITLFRREVKGFSDDEIALVETFAAQAVIAIENARQFRALQERTAEVESLNAGLESRVAEQVEELERMGRLKRFLSPQVANAVLSSGGDRLLGSHRALIAILFADIRGFTAFCESAEPEEAVELLQTYHEEMGRLIHAAGAGFDHRSGDGIMVIFNDPIPCDDPAGSALRMALAMRDRMAGLCRDWRKMGHRLGFGVGISLGYATVGMVGFEGRYDYTASGTSVNLAARLCDLAGDREILLSPRAAAAVDGIVELQSAGSVTLKGIHAPVDVVRVPAPG
ncbi:MAG: GAF domain-containing protein [Jhaorihella sp.]